MKIKNILMTFILVSSLFIVGCESKKEETNIKIVSDETIKTTLTNQISAIESISKTVELYKKDKIMNNDYSNEDYINMVLNQIVNTHQDTYLNSKEISLLNSSNIKANSYVSSNEVIAAVKDLTGPKTIDKVLKIEGCPSYTYDAKTDRYYINSNCKVNDRIISYVDEITYKDNEYFAVVYYGFVSDNVLYDNVNKNSEIAKLDSEGSYTIDKDNKDKFSKYTYKFVKNSDGDFVFESIEK